VKVGANPHIEKIPKADREKLELFTYSPLHNTVIGYAFFGEKPVAIETFPVVTRLPLSHSLRFVMLHAYFPYWQGWEIWERYSHLFPSKKIIFRFDRETATLILINEKATRKIFYKNQDLFLKYSPYQMSASAILEELFSPTSNKKSIIAENSLLLGIMLGYGRNNAIAFFNRRYIQQLRSFRLSNWHYPLDGVMDAGCMMIQNGTNERENAHVLTTLHHAKKIY